MASDSPTKEMKVIIKADDFWAAGGWRDPHWAKLFNIARMPGVKISVGVIGRSFEEITQEQVDFLKGQEGIQLFNHSYWHMNHGNGNPKEFFMTGPKYQEQSIRKTQEIVKEKLGITLDTIGFPANACDTDTLKVLVGTPELKYVYYVPGSYNEVELTQIPQKIIWIDTSLPDPVQLPREGVYCLQIHPGMDGSDNFEKVLLDLISRKVEFIWPNEI